MACSAATLVCVTAWFVAGAPNVPHLNLLTDPAADVFIRNGDASVGWDVIWGLAQVSPVAAHLVLFILSVSVATAAVLSLILLLRSDRTDATSYLGVGLGWWSLSVSYLGIFTTVTTFMFYEQVPFLARVAADTAAFLLLLAAATAVVRFWQGFPRPVSDAELDSFLQSSRRERKGSGGTPAQERHRSPRLKAALALFLVAGLGIIWRGGWYLPLERLDDRLSDIAQWLICFVILGAIYVLGWPVFKCLRLLKFHRALGDPEDRSRIEWIWTAIWIALILVLLPALAAPVMYLAERWFPELAFEFGWLGLYLLVAIASGPFIVIVALALSVFYRGAVDPRLALRGFTIWTLLGIVLTLIFVFIERTVATRVVQLLHLPPQTGYVTAGAIVAATFQPIRKRMEKWVNRFVERVLPESLLATGKRGTAAVAIVDIAGFTALAARDEQSAIVASALVQKEARRVAEAQRGRVVKSTGDGVILVFQDAADCLKAVQELHRSVAARAAALDLPALALHSGLHWGEVVEMHDGDVYGMTVNLAARIADWAKAGEIGVSSSFHGQLDAATADFQDAGPQSFKNVPEPVACLRLPA